MVFKSNILNTLQATSNLKVPLYRTYNDLPRDISQTGNIVYVYENQTYYGYNHQETTWQPLNINGRSFNGTAGTTVQLLPSDQVVVFYQDNNSSPPTDNTLEIPDPTTQPTGRVVKIVNHNINSLGGNTGLLNVQVQGGGEVVWTQVGGGGGALQASSFNVHESAGIHLMVLPNPLNTSQKLWFAIEQFAEIRLP